MMESINGLLTLLLIIVFIGIWVWAWSSKNKAKFEKMSKLPLEENEDKELGVKEND